MSREKKPNRFGARISSIFNSAEAHHHLEKKASNASLKPLSHPQLSNKPSVGDLSGVAANANDTHAVTKPAVKAVSNDPNSESIHKHSGSNTDKYNQTPKHNASNYDAKHNSGGEKTPQAPVAPVPRLSRRPPPDLSPKPHKSDDLGDIIGSLEQEIDQMMGSPNLELTTTMSRSYLSAPSSPDHVNGLSLKKSPKDFDISRQIRPVSPPTSEPQSPLRQLHSHRSHPRDADDAPTKALAPVTPKGLGKTDSMHRHSQPLDARSPGIPSPAHDLAASMSSANTSDRLRPSSSADNPDTLRPMASTRNSNNYSLMPSPSQDLLPSSSSGSARSPDFQNQNVHDFHDKNQTQPSFQNHDYGSEIDMHLFKTDQNAGASDYGYDQNATDNDLGGVIDGYNYGSSVSVLKSDPFANQNERFRHNASTPLGNPTVSPHQVYNDTFSEKESMSIASSEQFRDDRMCGFKSDSRTDFQHGASNDFMAAHDAQSSLSRASDTGESEPFFKVGTSDSAKPSYVAPESLDAEINSLTQGIQAFGQNESSQEMVSGIDSRSMGADSHIPENSSSDHFDTLSYAPSMNRFHRQESLKTFSSGNRFADGYPTTPLQTGSRTHQRMSSTSSILSSTSNRHVNLGTLKRTLNLRPGEGEHSMYVDTIRRNAGTSYNETGPGKWKLPLGIQPVDKRVMAQLSSQHNRPKLLSSRSRATKSSGVELKHGHLQPRLLAAEVDETGETSSRFGSLAESRTPKSTGPSTRPVTPVTSKSSTPSGGQNFVSRTNSLERAGTLASVSTTNDAHSSLSKNSGRRGSTESSAESVGSINDSRKVDIYYQHPGYKYKEDADEDDLDTDDYTNMNDRDDSSSDDGAPRLVLANPDASYD